MLDRYDIRDLRLFTGNDLRVLLTEEAALWQQRLRWDYMQSIGLLLKYLDSRILPGFVAIERASGSVAGYCFSVYETQKAVVGDVFASGPEARSLETLLLHHLLPLLQHTPGVERIESQLLLESRKPAATLSGCRFCGSQEAVSGSSIARSARADTGRRPGAPRGRKAAATTPQPEADTVDRTSLPASRRPDPPLL